MRIILPLIFLFTSLNCLAQENLFGKPKDEVRELFKGAKFTLLSSSVSNGVDYDSFDCGNRLETQCFYDKNGCVLVKEIMPLASLDEMTAELNANNTKIKGLPNTWLNVEGTARIEMVIDKKNDSILLSFIPVHSLPSN